MPVVVGPALVGAATLAARRWGQRVAGAVSAVPAIVGPVLVIGAERHGTAFAAQTAVGTLLGLAALSGFAVVYGRVALRRPWPGSLGCAWPAAAAIGALMQVVDAGLIGATAIALVSLALAYQGLPDVPAPPPAQPRAPLDLVMRMTLTAALSLLLAAAAGVLGAKAGGILAALPVLACILATFVHARHGGAVAVQLLRGMLSGMVGFVVFCFLVAALIESAGPGVTFALAGATALGAHAVVLSTARAGRLVRPGVT